MIAKRNFTESLNWKKLNWRDVAEARSRVAAGERPAAIAREMGVRRTTIDYHVKCGKASPHPYAIALATASKERRAGNFIEAARQLRAAATAIELGD